MAGAEGLPADLLAAIYRRCTSAYDRARFAAVSTSWRAVASWHPKLPAIPLLLPSTANGRRDRMTRAYSPEDGRVLRAPLPGLPKCRQIVGSHDGGWVAAATGSRIVVVNLFGRGRISVQKIIFSEDPVSKGCILAAITTTGCKIGLYRRGSLEDGGADGGWITRGCGWVDDGFPALKDIAFCNGELYGLSWTKMLYRFVIGQNKSGAPVITSVDQVTMAPMGYGDAEYIIELCGKLAIALEISNPSKGKKITVFELAVNPNKTTWSSLYVWVKVVNLGEHALFLGAGCCKAVHVSSTADKRGIVEANCIYYSSNDDYPSSLVRLDLGSCFVYCCESNLHHS
ncbi:hypothetical protein VPH35_122350 [Triticum aestivum]